MMTLSQARILFILPDLHGGGAQRVMLNVMRHLKGRKAEIALMVVCKTGCLFKELPEGVPVHYCRFEKVRYALPEILFKCWREKPDIVVSTMGHLNLCLLSGRKILPSQVKVIVREANTPSVRLGQTKHPWAYFLLYNMLYPWADGIICNSRYMQQDLIDQFGIYKGQTFIARNPVKINEIKNDEKSYRNPYSKKKCNLVAVGRLVYQKGFDLLLRSMKKVTEKISQVHLTILGDGSQRKNLNAMVIELELAQHVTFTGYKENPYPYMKHADIMVLPSRWEGSPNAVVESLACNTPVVAFHCPGGIDEIIRDNENGWLVGCGKVEELADALIDIIDEEKWIPLRKKNLLPDEYHWNRAMKQYENVLLDVLNQ